MWLLFGRLDTPEVGFSSSVEIMRIRVARRCIRVTALKIPAARLANETAKSLLNAENQKSIGRADRLEKKERQLQWRPRKRADPLLAQNLIEAQRPRAAMLAGAVVAMAGAIFWSIKAL